MAAKVNCFRHKQEMSVEGNNLNVWVDYSHKEGDTIENTIIMSLESAIQFPGALFTVKGLTPLRLKFEFQGIMFLSTQRTHRLRSLSAITCSDR